MLQKEIAKNNICNAVCMKCIMKGEAMFELYQLEEFIKVAECKTLSKASEELNISQPALSRAMKNLEDEAEVPLFNRVKNRIELNDNGILFLEIARKVVSDAHMLKDRVKEYDRSKRTVFVASSAPAPLYLAVPKLSELYSAMMIATELNDEKTVLNGLRNGTYSAAIISHPVEDENIVCVRFSEEHLCFFLPEGHRLALSDMDGGTMLLRSNLGFWQDIVDKKMKKTHFLVHEEDAFNELVMASNIPSFTSTAVQGRDRNIKNRVTVPIIDAEANVTYYCLVLRKNYQFFEKFLKSLPL